MVYSCVSRFPLSYLRDSRMTIANPSKISLLLFVGDVSSVSRSVLPREKNRRFKKQESVWLPPLLQSNLHWTSMREKKCPVERMDAGRRGYVNASSKRISSGSKRRGVNSRWLGNSQQVKFWFSFIWLLPFISWNRKSFLFSYKRFQEWR